MVILERYFYLRSFLEVFGLGKLFNKLIMKLMLDARIPLFMNLNDPGVIGLLNPQIVFHVASEHEYLRVIPLLMITREIWPIVTDLVVA